MKTAQQIRTEDYRSRINRVIDYIETHLGEEMALDELAGIAAFSRYHFHRVFAAMTGETLGAFIQRLRLERSALMLCRDHAMPVTRIALENGFSNHAAFSRAFKAIFGMSPSEYRRTPGTGDESNTGTARSNSGNTPSTRGTASQSSSLYTDDTDHSLNRRRTMKHTMPEKKPEKLTVGDMPPVTVAYVRHIGPYQGDSQLFEGLYGKLLHWAGPRGLFTQGETKFYCIYHDDPNVTAPEKLRVSVCIDVPPQTEVSGEVNKMEIPGGSYAQAQFHLGVDEYAAAWTHVYGEWLPGSGYVPDDRPSFELYQSGETCKDNPDGKTDVLICVPVKPMQ